MGSSSSGADAGGSEAGGSDTGGSDAASSACDNPSLVWHNAVEEVFASYQPAGYPPCQNVNGDECFGAGLFADCSQVLPPSWVASHNIVGAFRGGQTLARHAVCLKDPASGKTLAATVLDALNDGDCSGCFSMHLQPAHGANEVISVEFNTDQRFTKAGVDPNLWWRPNFAWLIQYADLGPAPPADYAGCQ
jgi:hypothetical protein